jgi:hypothetical protein
VKFIGRIYESKLQEARGKWRRLRNKGLSNFIRHTLLLVLSCHAEIVRGGGGGGAGSTARMGDLEIHTAYEKLLCACFFFFARCLHYMHLSVHPSVSYYEILIPFG